MRKLSFVAGLLAVTLVAGLVWSVSTAFFEVRTLDQFGKGKRKDLALAEPGTLSLACDKKQLLEVEGDFVWSVAVDKQGAVYAGTSKEGAVYVIRDGKSSKLETIEDAAVFAMALSPEGKLFVGGSPSGTIYSEGKVFAKTGETYVWALLFDAEGNLWAGTGPDGKLFRIDRKGNVKMILDSPAAHVMCLARDSKGDIWAGTAKEGIIYRVSPDGAAKVVYNAAETEIRCIAVDDKDRVYFGTADVSEGKGGYTGPVGVRRTERPMAPPSDRKGGETPGPGDATKSGPPDTTPRPAPRAAPRRDDVSATNSVYRISPDGSVLRIYQVRGKMIMSLLWHDGKLLAGTGNRGDLVAIDESLAATVLEEDMQGQVLCLAPGPQNEVVIGTGDQGRVFRFASDFVKEGEYVTEAFDAKFVSKFGAVSWTAGLPAGASVHVATRSGNTAEPDASWSAWSKPVRESGEAAACPPARFIQCKVTLSTSRTKSTPVLNDLKVAYLATNQPPHVKSVKVTTARDRKSQGQTEKQGAGRSTVVDVSWQAEDPNGDTLNYRVEFREAGAKNWRVLEKKTEKTSYSWNTDSVPDGTYEVQVAANDDADNPAGEGMSDSRVSTPFVVDNSRPAVKVDVKVAGGGKAGLAATMTDEGGIVTEAEYSLDSGEWKTLSADDGVFDSKSETAKAELVGLTPGEHTVTVRCTDDSSNIGAGSKTFTVK